jgi:hypothetical protein
LQIPRIWYFAEVDIAESPARKLDEVIGVRKLPRARCTFRETELRRAVRAIEGATGHKVAKVEVDPATGKIIVFPGGDAKAETAANPWDADDADQA